eukprot:TRINITY_DN101_c0_g4_i1.p2 TRINITY_DN101_c0_g4~~TRINITY_DN101_c0_g4_i1.p2  ORF type:complete len:173 (+),score=101.80 TRINITY_DN101_c0_g4_i1:65-520(+)
MATSPVKTSPAKARTPKKERKAKKSKKDKVKKGDGEEGKKRRKKATFNSYKSYIHRLIKQKVADKKQKLQITSRGIAIVDSFVLDLFDRLAGEAGRLSSHANLKTLGSKAVIAAVKMHLPAGLATHALSAGATSVAAYSKSVGKKEKKEKK